MNRDVLEEFILASGVIAVTIGLLLVAQALAPDMFDRLTGHATIETRVNVIPSPPIICDTAFEPGWNLISLFCVRNGQSVEEALDPINGSYESIFAFDPSAGGAWHSYNPSLPSWAIQDLTSFYRGNGYWLNVPSGAYYYLNGTKRITNTIAIVPGWNLIGYPTNESRDIDLVLQSSTTANITQVRAYNASVPAWRTYPPNATLHDFTPYWGYWVYSNSSGTMTVNW